MIGYHWSPSLNERSIKRYGLLVPNKHPRIIKPMVCSEGHRNPHISLGKTPSGAWELSGGFLLRRDVNILSEEIPEWWNLYQVDLDSIRYLSNGYELQVRVDIKPSRIRLVGVRNTKGL